MGVRAIGGLAVDGVPTSALGSRKQRRLLGRLVLADGAVVRVDDLADDLWGEQQPAHPRADLSVLVSRLRAALPDDALVRREGGYALDLRSDLAALRDLSGQALQRAGAQQWAAAAEAARAALELVRGEVLPELADATWVQREQEALDQLVQQARTVLARAELAVGDPRVAAEVARQVLATSPYDEVALRLHLEACLAARAPGLGLATFAAFRERLADDLGVDPAPETLALHAGLLAATQDDRAVASEAAGEQVTTRYARTADGLHIAYQVTGDGPIDLLFCVGLLSHVEAAWQFPENARFFHRLAAFSRLIRFDKRGSGLSDPVPGPVTLEDRVEDIRAVLDAAGCERAVLLGVSEGGTTSMMFAAQEPERTRGLVLYGTGARATRGDGYPWGFEREEVEGLIELVVADWGSPDNMLLGVLAPTLADDEVVKEAFGRFVRVAASPGQFAATSRTNIELDAGPVLPALRVPTVVVHRDGDLLFELGHGRHLAEQIAGAQLVVLPGQDHVHLVDPDQIADEVERFVRELPEHVASDLRLSTVVCVCVEAPDQDAAVGDLVARGLDRAGGTLLDRSATGLVARFPGPVAAVRFAHELGSRLRGLDVPHRVGVHAGPVPAHEHDPGSLTVRTAERLCGLAEDGQVLVSADVRDLVAGSGIALRELPSAVPGTALLVEAL